MLSEETGSFSRYKTRMGLPSEAKRMKYSCLRILPVNSVVSVGLTVHVFHGIFGKIQVIAGNEPFLGTHRFDRFGVIFRVAEHI